MNVMDKLKEKERLHREQLTEIEKLILACPSKTQQLFAAAELHELKNGRTFGDAKDLSELTRKQV